MSCPYSTGKTCFDALSTSSKFFTLQLPAANKVWGISSGVRVMVAIGRCLCFIKDVSEDNNHANGGSGPKEVARASL